MADQLPTLLLLSLSMFLGSYISGFIPMFVGLSEEKVRMLTILGSGILVGTALSVIIPEGVNAMYSSPQHHHHFKVEEGPVKDGQAEIKVDSHQHSHENNGQENHSAIGITLVTGFVFMFVLDQVVKKHSSPTSYSAVDTVEDPSDSVSVTVSTTPHPHHVKRKSSKMTATIGLIVHSAADGVALGAAASTAHTDVEMIVFLAIMLHKAPAAFGLVTFLLHEGLDKSKIKRHLFAFSMSAPLGTLITYVFLGGEAFQSEYNTTGIAMLFSAGTFLFVATVHVLPEMTQERELKMTEVLVLIVGSFIPSLLSVHHHHH